MDWVNHVHWSRWSILLMYFVILCFPIVCYMYFSNNDDNSGVVSYEGSKYKSSLLNVYDLIDGQIR